MNCNLLPAIRFTKLFNPLAHLSKKVQKRQLLRDELVVDVSSESTWKGNQSYVFGFCATGALGVKHLVVPRTPIASLRRNVSHPIRLSAIDNPIGAACGYGFTLYLCKPTSSTRSVYGCGLNSDGQLGQLHGLTSEKPRTDQLITVIPAPQQIHLPLSEEEQRYIEPTHLACGRAHALIATHPHQPANSLQQPILFSMGNNTFGQCGRQMIPDEIYSPQTAVTARVQLPVEISGLRQVGSSYPECSIHVDQSIFSVNNSSDRDMILLLT